MKHLLLILCLITGFATQAQTIDNFKYKVDTSITNKTAPGSIKAVQVGQRIKELAEIVRNMGDTCRNDTTLLATRPWVLSQNYVDHVLWSQVQSKPVSFPPSAHNHLLSEILQSGASSGQVPTWNGSQWVPGTPSSPIDSTHFIYNQITANQPAGLRIARKAFIAGGLKLGDTTTADTSLNAMLYVKPPRGQDTIVNIKDTLGNNIWTVRNTGILFNHNVANPLRQIRIGNDLTAVPRDSIGLTISNAAMLFTYGSNVAITARWMAFSVTGQPTPNGLAVKGVEDNGRMFPQIVWRSNHSEANVWDPGLSMLGYTSPQPSGGSSRRIMTISGAISTDNTSFDRGTAFRTTIADSAVQLLSIDNGYISNGFNASYLRFSVGSAGDVYYTGSEAHNWLAIASGNAFASVAYHGFWYNGAGGDTLKLPDPSFTGGGWPSLNVNGREYSLINQGTGPWVLSSSIYRTSTESTNILPPGSSAVIVAVAGRWNIKTMTTASKGNATISGTGGALTYTVPHGTGQTGYRVTITPTSADAAAGWYITNRTATSFDIVFISTTSGTNNISFDWAIAK